MAELRSRRSNLAVPGSNPRFLEKAKGLPADQVFLDLEDACAPLAKPEARHTIVKFLNEGKDVPEEVARKIESTFLRTRHKRTVPVTPADEWWREG